MKTLFLVITILTSALWVSAQHYMHNMPGMRHTDTTKHSNENDMQNMDMSDNAMPMNMMPSGQSLNLPMSRNGSGTSWLPDATPVYGYMLHLNKWMFMFHGDVFVRYNRQDISNSGSRGGKKWDAPNMLMAMAQRKIGDKGFLHFNAMFSADALIAGGNGYPLLFQTGESWQGKPLIDRQHPHDLFSELSASYAYAISHKADVSLYVGYPGEPALGPVTFMHRPSGMFMPDVPISHHWVDATHITFGVATLGVRYGRFKLEGSSFTGREPDEQRYNFDKPLFDSWSGRLSYNPSANWALQLSHGFIKSPEALYPGEDIARTTASATCIYPITGQKYFTATLLWGQNKMQGQSSSNSVLAEATLKLKRITPYLRMDWVQKSGEELNLDQHIYDPSILHPLSTATLGAGYDLLHFAHIQLAAGAQLSAALPDLTLRNIYGNLPLSGEIYLHFYLQQM